MDRERPKLPRPPSRSGLQEPAGFRPADSGPPASRPRAQDPSNGAGELSILIDEEGTVVFSDLPEDLADLVRALTDDPRLLSRLPEPSEPSEPPTSPRTEPPRGEG